MKSVIEVLLQFGGQSRNAHVNDDPVIKQILIERKTIPKMSM